MTRILIDGDPIAYRSGFASQKTVYQLERGDDIQKYGEGITFSTLTKSTYNIYQEGDVLQQVIEPEPVANALLATKHFVEAMYGEVRNLTTDPHIELYLTHEKAVNHRMAIAKTAPYKAGRVKPTRWTFTDGQWVPDPNTSAQFRPVHYKAIREYLDTYYSPIWVIEGEADDAVAEAAYNAEMEGLDYLVVHVDKDLNQIVGKHYNPVRKESYSVTGVQALRFFYKQMLTGDSVDNILGVKQIGKTVGFGEAMAARFIDYLTTEEEMYDVIIKHYNEQYGSRGEEVATETGQLLYLSRFIGDLWNPPHKRESFDYTSSQTDCEDLT